MALAAVALAAVVEHPMAAASSSAGKNPATAARDRTRDSAQLALAVMVMLLTALLLEMPAGLGHIAAITEHKQ